MTNSSKIFILLGFLILPLFLLPLKISAQDQMTGQPVIEIHAPYSFATISNAPSGAVFFEVLNNGTEDDKLIEAKSDVAEFTEVHQNYIDEDDGTMMMRKIPNIPVPAGGKAILKPTGYHIMLIRLKQQLRLEDSFPLTLIFEKSGEVTVDVNVIPPGTRPVHSRHRSHNNAEDMTIKMDHSMHDHQATGEAVNLLEPLVPTDLGQTNVVPQPDSKSDNFIQESADQVNRILLEDGSDYVEDINAENLDIENYE